MSVATFADDRAFQPLPRPRPAEKIAATAASLLLHAAVAAGLLILAARPGEPTGTATEVVLVELVGPEEAADTPEVVPAPAAAAERAAEPPAPQETAVSEPPVPPEVIEPPPPVEPPTEVAKVEPPPEPVAPPTEVARVEAPPEPVETTPIAPPVVTATAEPMPLPPPPVVKAVEKPAPTIAKPVDKPAPQRRSLDKPRAQTPVKPMRSADATATGSLPPAAAASGGAKAAAGERNALAAYLASVNSQINALRRSTVGSERGRVVVQVTIAADGRLGDLRAAGGVDAVLEDQALKVIRRASPVEPIPPVLHSTSLVTKVTVVFE